MTGGIALHRNEFGTICNLFQVEPKKRLEDLDNGMFAELQYICRALDRDTKEVEGYVWFNVQDDKWYWFQPENVSEELEALFQ